MLSAGCVVALLLPSAVAAQPCMADPTTHAYRCAGSGTGPRTADHITALGINAGLGALTAGVTQHLRGRSFWKGFVGGAVGGGLSYAGKRVATAEFGGSGIVGREIAAVGSSVIVNAATGEGLLDRVVLPLGPLRMEVQLRAGVELRPRVDVPNLIFAVYTAARPGMEIDWSESVASGAPVFIDRTPATDWAGRHGLGVIILKQDIDLVDPLQPGLPSVLRHERVHLLQHDFTSAVWGRPAEGRILGTLPGGPVVHRFVDLRLDMLLWGMMNAALRHADRPSEREAYLLNGRSH
jgi:hypothetical protein